MVGELDRIKNRRLNDSDQEENKHDSSVESIYDTHKKKKNGGRHRIKFKRWSRQDDKKLYKLLLRMNDIDGQTIDILRAVEEDDAEDFKPLLTSIANMCKWKGWCEDLLKRIKKIMKPSDFSVREKKHLKKLIKKGLNGKKVDFDAILQEFPGKDSAVLISAINGLEEKYKILNTLE